MDVLGFSIDKAETQQQQTSTPAAAAPGPSKASKDSSTCDNATSEEVNDSKKEETEKQTGKSVTLILFCPPFNSSFIIMLKEEKPIIRSIQYFYSNLYILTPPEPRKFLKKSFITYDYKF